MNLGVPAEPLAIMNCAWMSPSSIVISAEPILPPEHDVSPPPMEPVRIVVEPVSSLIFIMAEPPLSLLE